MRSDFPMPPDPRAARGVELATRGEIVDEGTGESIGRQLLLHDGGAARRARRLLLEPRSYAALAKDVAACRA